MSEANKQLVQRALEEIYSQGKLEVADELIHPDFVDLDLSGSHPEGPTGPENVKATVRRLRASFGALRFETHEAIPEGDRVVQRVTMSGRHCGPLMDSEPTGREFAVQHVYGWRIADGLIAEHWGVRDDLGLLRQLGLLSPS